MCTFIKYFYVGLLELRALTEYQTLTTVKSKKCPTTFEYHIMYCIFSAKIYNVPTFIFGATVTVTVNELTGKSKLAVEYAKVYSWERNNVACLQKVL